jgi:hypothetical protein
MGMINGAADTMIAAVAMREARVSSLVRGQLHTEERKSDVIGLGTEKGWAIALPL